ncbi:MAG: hypothetical protein JW795_19110 [Chitinivibrionales bacterium]|nr:hypothetical protein [Chitinivibrionales bacterium]
MPGSVNGPVFMAGLKSPLPSIDGSGKVIYSCVLKSTLNDCPMELEEFVLINNLTFKKFSNPFDLTEVIYPFVFSQ